MQIPKNLPQFKRDQALLLVTGRQDAVLYHVSNGKLEKLNAFEILNPSYSDNEGMFGKRGRGTTFRPGAPKEFDRESLIREFLQELKRRIKKTPQFSKLFIFAPAQTKNKIGSVLPIDWQKKIEAIFPGNFYSFHPLDLLKKLLLINV